MRYPLLLVSILGFFGPPSLLAEVSPSVQACRTARAEAWEALRYDRLWKEPKEPSKAAHEKFLLVADQCMAASEAAANSLDSAYLVAESAICRAIYEKQAGIWDNNRQPEIVKEELRDGIELVYQLDGEWSPALLELFDRLSILEWLDEPREASRRLEQRVEIARRAYGEADPRYAEALMEAAQRYEPYHMAGDREIRGADDPELAEQHYRAALKVFAKDPKRRGSEIYRDILWSMQLFYEDEGREKEARNLAQTLDEIRLEIELDEKLEREDTEASTSRQVNETEPRDEASGQDDVEGESATSGEEEGGGER